MIQKVESSKRFVWLVTGKRSYSSTARAPFDSLRVGASSGLGLALLKRIIARGDRVIATARTPSKIATLLPDAPADQLLAMYLDVTASSEDIQDVVNAAVVHWGRIDVLVNNAGLIDTIGPAEELGFVLRVYVHAVNGMTLGI